jgi:glycine cleavage system H protein
MTIPAELRYTNSHEWVRLGEGTVRVGITDYAQDALGDVVFVTLPAPGTVVAAGEVMGEVESTKTVSDLYAPVSGTVAARNEALTDASEQVNTDPYGTGWLVDIELSGQDGLADLLDADAYAALTEDH